MDENAGCSCASVLGENYCICAVCGEDVSASLENVHLKLNFSFEDGGVVCLRCSNKTEVEKMSAQTIKLIHNLIHTKFEEIKLIRVPEDIVDETLHFCKK